MKKIFIGIDPGTQSVGYSVLFSSGEKFKFLKTGVLKIGREEKFKFKIIYEYFYEIFLNLKKSYNLEIILCVESQFVFKNPASTFLIVSAKTIFLLLAQQFSFSSVEISPRKIKKIVFGNGNADKFDIQNAISNFFEIRDFSSFDESDAMAISFAAAILDNKIQ